MRRLILTLIILFTQPAAAAGVIPFTADYEIYYGNLHLGKARYHLSHETGNDYVFEFVSDLKFLIFSDNRVVRSTLSFTQPRFRSRYYSHDRRGTGPDYFEEIRFERAENRIQSTYKKETKEFSYEQDIIDGLTVQLQMILDLRRGIEQPKYQILDANRLREREFSFISEQTINVLDVDYHTVMYQLVRDNDRRTTRIWFSPEQDYLPVQMVHFANGKKQFNARLVRYHETKDADVPDSE